MNDNHQSYQPKTNLGMAIDPIHVGTGATGLGRVDNAIVRDPVTRVPKIPGSSLAGVSRTYAAMAKGRFPNCAGLGQTGRGGSIGHCGKPSCPICVVFGFARGNAGGFAGLAAFSDAHVLLFPVATREGPVWLTCPMAARVLGHEIQNVTEDAVYRCDGSRQPLNLGWLLLPTKPLDEIDAPKSKLSVPSSVPSFVRERLAVVSDKLFSHIVNSNLEVRTSVSINPKTGAAEERALFTYEALPRSTVLFWEVISKNPAHFKVGNGAVEAVNEMTKVFEVVKEAHPYLECLGIGGMGTRGMGRLRVLSPKGPSEPSAADGGKTGGA